MHQSKLLVLLSTFSRREWKQFQAFVASPYFNRQSELSELVGWLAEKAPEWHGLTRETAFGVLFPGSEYEDAKLNHFLSYLYKLAEQFIGIERFCASEQESDLFVLSALAERNLDKHYRFVYEKTQRLAAAGQIQDAGSQLRRYRLENLEANRLSQSSVRRHNQHVQNAADYLDRFYLAEKLRCTCYMLTSQLVLATPYNLSLVDEICRFLEKQPLDADTPVISAYYRIFRMLTNEQAHPDFEALKKLLKQHSAHFNREELAELYQYAINFCNLQIMKVQMHYVDEALDLYNEAVDSGILLQKGFLSPWHYKNMIKLSLRLKRFAWTEQFIREKTGLLEPQFREDAFHYNLAELFYYTGSFGQAQYHLNQVEFTDVHYNLGAKKLLAKIYFAAETFDALESLLHAFRTYLNRNKLISNELRRTYLNFIGILRQSMYATADRKKALCRKIENTKLLTEKTWLLQINE